MTPQRQEASRAASLLALPGARGNQAQQRELAGIEDLPILVDATGTAPGQTLEGTVTITDAAAGKAWPVKVTARVGGVFEFVVGHAYDYLGRPGHAASWDAKPIDDLATFNVPVGGSETRRFVFINHSGRELNFKIGSPAAWMKVSPATGKIGPRGRTTVDVTAAPPDKSAARHAVVLKVGESDGAAAQEAKMDVYVVPPYARPAEPTGEAVPLAKLDKASVVEHRSRAYWYGSSERGRDDFGPKFDEEGNIDGGTPQCTVVDIEGKGYIAFAATVQIVGQRQRVNERNAPPGSAADKIVNFEVYADDVLVAQSGLVTARDEPRRIVAPIPPSAKRLKLLVRWDRPEPKYLGGTVGINWLQPKLYKP